MSKTVRRKTGNRWWTKPQSDAHYIRGWRWERFTRYDYNEIDDVLTKMTYTEYVFSSTTIWERKKHLSREEINKIESDRGFRSDYGGKKTTFFKELNKVSRRSKQKKELHKVKESCYNGFDDIYDYDQGFEEAAERSHIWVCF